MAKRDGTLYTHSLFALLIYYVAFISTREQWQIIQQIISIAVLNLFPFFSLLRPNSSD
jgi:hypothetical protein